MATYSPTTEPTARPEPHSLQRFLDAVRSLDRSGLYTTGEAVVRAELAHKYGGEPLPEPLSLDLVLAEEGE